MDTIVIEKFWRSVERTKTCWNWTGPVGKSGLPVIRTGTRETFKEHSPRRISLQLAGKEISPSDRAQPLICQNKLCVNPTHLVIGDEARFWAKVHRLGDDDCWVWIAAQDKDMYGKFRVDGKDIRAHQYSWQLFSGRPVPPGIQVCHKCDHPYCVNPNHLFLGTTKDNTQDRHEKCRDARGEKIGSSKMNEEKVKEIRELYVTGNYTQDQLSNLYGVVQSVISSIVLEKTWKHVQ